MLRFGCIFEDPSSYHHPTIILGARSLYAAVVASYLRSILQHPKQKTQKCRHPSVILKGPMLWDQIDVFFFFWIAAVILPSSYPARRPKCPKTAILLSSYPEPLQRKTKNVDFLRAPTCPPTRMIAKMPKSSYENQDDSGLSSQSFLGTRMIFENHPSPQK